MSSDSAGANSGMSLIQERIQKANLLYNTSESLSHINGCNKLLKKIKAELNFLSQLEKNKNFRPEHLHSSNLSNLSAIVKVAQEYPGKVTALYHPIKYEGTNGGTNRQVIDIVAEGGKVWIKVIARNPLALERICSGNSEFGVRSIIDQAEDLLAYAQQNLHVFIPPTITMYFVSGITENLLQKLTKLGVLVHGAVVESKLDDLSDDDNESLDDSASDVSEADCDYYANSGCLNLDISTLISYSSSLTNGGCHHTFHEAVLNEEAEAERKRPVGIILDELFKDKVLCCCETAVADFRRIVQCVGGATEKTRAEHLLSRIRIIPDEISELAQRLELGGKIKERSQIIFGTGDSIKAMTVTANSAFVRAAAGQGVKFAVFEHEARTLSEQKQI